MAQAILLSAAVFSFPIGIHFIRITFPILRKINPIVAAYIFGLLLVNTGIIGEDAFPVLDTIATVTVALSIPLMLFSVNIRTWFKESGKTGIAMGLAALSITLTLFLGSFIFKNNLPDFPRLSGMLVGVYTGGTPNLAAIRAALSVPADLYLAVHASDILLSALYLMFIMTIARKVFGRFMISEITEEAEMEGIESTEQQFTPLKELFVKGTVLPLMGALGLAVLIFAIGGSFTLLVNSESQTLVVILVITTLSLLASNIEKVRNIPKTFAFGEYFILVFSAATGAMGNFSRILSSTPMVFVFVAFAVVVSMLIHVLLCRIFKIDVDTMLIASTAAICSPPFVGVTAMALKRPSLVAPGITAGLMGYALGNYLGVMVFKLFSLL
ncbi:MULTISPECIES: DUF819 family protein [unclassified Oceanispirochaeta]|uniref:DUF819 family protein n=1 Tax=unclassified Oceanispirochaeta TaxID=2635722 RepID=UPI000E0990FF|nr:MULTISPECIES: DUF819 family protein [unclassified Oceanispirochaeta]MBF9014795.1 DUF819 family protein [Oceanispirochaeta sp. M2]NPD71051.1 DUF819 family protein [Oceanispirochaeta sp. M1]RDG33884.1 DUF819 family protein [Oceanispirochaeta sp. M1]